MMVFDAAFGDNDEDEAGSRFFCLISSWVTCNADAARCPLLRAAMALEAAAAATLADVTTWILMCWMLKMPSWSAG